MTRSKDLECHSKKPGKARLFLFLTKLPWALGHKTGTVVLPAELFMQASLRVLCPSLAEGSKSHS